MNYKILLVCFFASTHAWSHTKRNTVKASAIAPIFVTVSEEVTPVLNSAKLPCHFKMCSGNKTPVSITWKIGSDPYNAETIATCSSYDPETNKVTDFKDDYMTSFSGRLKMDDGHPPALTVSPIHPETDNQNVWCQVQTSEKNEFGTDVKSTVLRMRGYGTERPKFNVVTVPKTIVDGSSGHSITLECSCDGYHCDDVGWYKGPIDVAGNLFEKIYEKHTVYRGDPDITYGPGWENRISVSEYSLTIHKLTATDVGRYWCKAKGADYYSLGDTGTDAKSIVLTVDQPGAC